MHRKFSVSLTTEAESGETVLFGTTVSDLQENVVIEGSHINGTLKYYNDPEAALVQRYGAGNFIALKFETENADEVWVGMDPSEETGLVKLDSDMNGVWKVTDKEHQVLKVIAKNADFRIERTFALNTLTTEVETVG